MRSGPLLERYIDQKLMFCFFETYSSIVLEKDTIDCSLETCRQNRAEIVRPFEYGHLAIRLCGSFLYRTEDTLK